MDLPVEESSILDKRKLQIERNIILNRRNQLAEEFRLYALGKLRESTDILEIKYTLIDNDEKLKYEDFEIGEFFAYELASFKFNLQTERIIDYQKETYWVTKQTEKMEDLPDECAERVFNIRKLQQTLALTSEFEQQKIVARIQSEVDKIVSKIFKFELVYNDYEYKKLIRMHAYLENALQEVNRAIAKSNSQQEETTKSI